ncbi:hypothetical protein GL263_21260 [Streptomyces durbertensis]|uniref:DUF7144 domain-containing protein n=1 Tax=Streptomyces durbertensis TaxID=2448886 RepID=A0ABR6EL42_9ACTN|nr:hypothetical protein [Streptomyces durbertensis]MBB1246061.1 hypothetical protein [Streptomyces durbertensis]
MTSKTDAHHETTTADAFAGGVVLFAAVMLLITGVFDILRGVMAIAGDDVFVVAPEYVFEMDLTGWGWVHLVLGVLAVLISFGLMKLSLWARMAGVAIASLIIVANFLSLPYYPIWALVSIAFGALVIWGLATAHPDSLTG